MIDFYLTAILQGLCLSMMALGVFISMKIFNIPDITTDGSYTLGAVITAVCLTAGVHPLLTLPLAILAGSAAGALTAWVHTRFKMNPLLAGILVMTALYSVNLGIMGRSNIPLIQIDTVFSALPLFEDVILNNALTLVLFVGAFIALLSYLLKTDFGLAMRATGNSESMIRALGVNTKAMKMIGLAMANALTAAGGYLMAQMQGFTDINMGIGIVIAGLGSVAMGEAFANRLKLSNITLLLLMMVGGAVAFQLALAVALSLGIGAAWLKLVTAVLVLLIVALPQFSLKRTS